MKKLLLILSFIVFCGNNLHSQLTFITPSEGLSTAKTEMQKVTNNYNLVGIFTASVVLNMQSMPITIYMSLSGDNIGKANMWDYVFWDKDKSEFVEIVAVQVVPMGNQWVAMNLSTGGGLLTQMPLSILEGINVDATLDLTNILSSKEWVPQLLQKEGVILNEELSDESGYIIGVWMPTTLKYGHRNQFNWYCVNVNNDIQTWCYSLASNTDITCETPNDIVELPAVNVEISPNPAADMLIISADSELKDVNIYDISGNLVKQCGENVINIDISGLLAGTYYISFSFGDVTVFRLFVKK